MSLKQAELTKWRLLFDLSPSAAAQLTKAIRPVIRKYSAVVENALCLGRAASANATLNMICRDFFRLSCPKPANRATAAFFICIMLYNHASVLEYRQGFASLVFRLRAAEDASLLDTAMIYSNLMRALASEFAVAKRTDWFGDPAADRVGSAKTESRLECSSNVALTLLFLFDEPLYAAVCALDLQHSWTVSYTQTLLSSLFADYWNTFISQALVLHKALRLPLSAIVESVTVFALVLLHSAVCSGSAEQKIAAGLPVMQQRLLQQLMVNLRTHLASSPVLVADPACEAEQSSRESAAAEETHYNCVKRLLRADLELDVVRCQDESLVHLLMQVCMGLLESPQCISRIAP